MTKRLSVADYLNNQARRDGPTTSKACAEADDHADRIAESDGLSPIEDGVITYDDLIEDQEAAVAELLEETS